MYTRIIQQYAGLSIVILFNHFLPALWDLIGMQSSWVLWQIGLRHGDVRVSIWGQVKRTVISLKIKQKNCAEYGKWMGNANQM